MLSTHMTQGQVLRHLAEHHSAIIPESSLAADIHCRIRLFVPECHLVILLSITVPSSC